MGKKRIKKPLPRQQGRLLAFIEKQIARNGESPTYRQMGEYLKINPKTAYEYATALVEKGYLFRSPLVCGGLSLKGE